MCYNLCAVGLGGQADGRDGDEWRGLTPTSLFCCDESSITGSLLSLPEKAHLLYSQCNTSSRETQVLGCHRRPSRSKPHKHKHHLAPSRDLAGLTPTYDHPVSIKYITVAEKWQTKYPPVAFRCTISLPFAPSARRPRRPASGQRMGTQPTTPEGSSRTAVWLEGAKQGTPPSALSPTPRSET